LSAKGEVRHLQLNALGFTRSKQETLADNLWFQPQWMEGALDRAPLSEDRKGRLAATTAAAAATATAADSSKDSRLGPIRVRGVTTTGDRFDAVSCALAVIFGTVEPAQ
jgi:hypothetical protein